MGIQKTQENTWPTLVTRNDHCKVILQFSSLKI